MNKIKKEPKVSIIITYYNLGDYVEEAIQSTLNQTYKNIEIILVNDGSTDENSIKKLDEVKLKYKNKITFIDQKNSGVATARNNGIKKSTGEYICCLDGDDILTPKYIEKTTKVILKDKNIGFVTSWVKLFGEVNQTWKCKEYDPLLIYIENIVHISSLFRKEVWEKVNGYSTNVNGYEDWDFWIKIVSLGYTWKLIPKSLFMYRKRGHSLINEAINKRPFLMINIIKNNIDKYKEIYPELLILLDSNYQNEKILKDKLYGTIEKYKNSKTDINLKNKKILLVCDTQNWAFSNIAKSMKKNLVNQLNIDIDYIVNYGDLNIFFDQLLQKKYDIIHFFWRLVPCEFFNRNLNNYLKNIKDIKLISKPLITSSVYDHAFLDDKSIEKYSRKFDSIVDFYTVSSKKLFNIYSKIHGIKKPNYIISDGVDLELFYPINTERFNKKKKKLIIGWVGNSKWSIKKGDDIKGIKTIIKPVIKKLQKDGFNVEEYFADRNIAFIPLEKMVDYYKKIDVLICASKVEGTPNPVLEAMACGVPVISTNVGIVPEVFGEKQRSFIIKRRQNELISKIKFLYENPNTLKQLSKENIKQIKNFTRVEESKKWFSFFKDSLEQRQSNKDKEIDLLKIFLEEAINNNKRTENRIRFRKTLFNKIEIGLFLKKKLSQ